MNKHPAPPARPSFPAAGSAAKPSVSGAKPSVPSRAADTGTARIQGPDGLRIPDPHLPKPDAPTPKKPVAKPAEKKPEPYVRVPSAHIIAGLATSSAQNRLVRLQSLAHRNRDVAWLLEQIKPKSSSSSFSSSSSKPKTPSDRQS